MLRRIVLENYMSHARTAIELAEGLTVLVGPNNCGKSAVVSALQTVCGDNAGDFMVRHGETCASVTVETDDGHVITWRRKGRSPGYVIDGREISRAGRGNLPDDLHTLLRLNKVEPANRGGAFDIHFGEQKKPIFLIDNEADVAAFFSTSSDAEKLMEIQKLHKQKVAAARNEHRSVTEELAQIDGQLASLDPLNELEPQVCQLEQEHSAIEQQLQRIEWLGQLIARLEAAACRQEELRRRCSALSQMQTPPQLADVSAIEPLIRAVEICDGNIDFHRSQLLAMSVLSSAPQLAETGGMEQIIRRLEAASDQLAHWRDCAAGLRGLHEPPVLADELRLERICREMLRFTRERSRFSASWSAMAGLAEPPVPSDTAHLERLLRNLAAADAALAGARRCSAIVQELKEPPATIDPAELQDLLGRIAHQHKLTAQCKAAVKASEIESVDLERQIAAYVAANPMCPLCGAQLDEKRILAGGHAHG